MSLAKREPIPSVGRHMTYEQIGEEMGLTKQQVFRIEKNAMDKIRRLRTKQARRFMWFLR